MRRENFKKMFENDFKGYPGPFLRFDFRPDKRRLLFSQISAEIAGKIFASLWRCRERDKKNTRLVR